MIKRRIVTVIVVVAIVILGWLYRNRSFNQSTLTTGNSSSSQGAKEPSSSNDSLAVDVEMVQTLERLLEAVEKQDWTQCETLRQKIAESKDAGRLLHDRLKSNPKTCFLVYYAARFIREPSVVKTLCEAYSTAVGEDKEIIINSLSWIGGDSVVDALCQLWELEKEPEYQKSIGNMIAAIASTQQLEVLLRHHKALQGDAYYQFADIVKSVKDQSAVAQAIAKISNKDFLKNASITDLDSFLSPHWPPAVQIPILTHLVGLNTEEASVVVMAALTTTKADFQEAVWTPVMKSMLTYEQPDEWVRRVFQESNTVLQRYFLSMVSIYGNKEMIPALNAVRESITEKDMLLELDRLIAKLGQQYK